MNNSTHQQTADPAGMAGMARRGSGLIVPAALAAAPDAAAKTVPTAYEADGRRRVVYTDDERRAIDKAIKLLKREGFGMIVGCVTRKDGKPACGGVLVPVGGDTPDPGFGCGCTRVHLERK